jgi:hypothetical protein
MTPTRGRLALASCAADGSAPGIPIVPVDPQLLQALGKSIVSCLGIAPGLPVSHFQHSATARGIQKLGLRYGANEPDGP